MGNGENLAHMVVALARTEYAKEHENEYVITLLRASMVQNVLEININLYSVILNRVVSYYTWFGWQCYTYITQNIYWPYTYSYIKYYVFIGCVIDTYPPAVSSKGLPKVCKNKYSCKRLARERKCTKTYKQINNWCSNKIKPWPRTKAIKTYCKRSCNICDRKSNANNC